MKNPKNPAVNALINLIKSMLLVGLSILSCTSQAALFGADDRRPVTTNSPFLPLARATAVAVLSSNYTETQPGKIDLAVDSLAGRICSEEKFSKDPSLSYACTGFLVGPDLLVTAGHCSVNVGESRNETETYCQAFTWLFDYRPDASGKVPLKDIPAENHYKCKKTIYAIREEKPPYRDFALVQLDRPVKDRMPLKLSTSEVRVGEPLFMLGHPMGMPLKLSPNAKVLLNNSARESFLTSLDAFEGNSGSPVFNSKNEVVGILIGGTPSESLIEVPARQCSKYNRCDDGGGNCLQNDADTSVFPGYQGIGSEVQKIPSLIETLNKYKDGKI